MAEDVWKADSEDSLPAPGGKRGLFYHFCGSRFYSPCREHRPVLGGSRRAAGRCVLSVGSLMVDTSQPCRAGSSPGILELGLRTLLMARKEAAYRALVVEGGCDQELKAGLSAVSSVRYLLEKAAQCKWGL